MKVTIVFASLYVLNTFNLIGLELRFLLIEAKEGSNSIVIILNTVCIMNLGETHLYI